MTPEQEGMIQLASCAALWIATVAVLYWVLRERIIGQAIEDELADQLFDAEYQIADLADEAEHVRQFSGRFVPDPKKVALTEMQTLGNVIDLRNPATAHRRTQQASGRLQAHVDKYRDTKTA